jgi:tetratricopeptide (TPR) repeat protein
MKESPLAITEPKIFRQLFLGISAAILILMPLLSKDYGQSADEWIQIVYGKHIWDYFTIGDQQALDYTNMSLQFTHQNYYGGMFDFTTEVLHRWFPSIQVYILRHFCNSILGALMMVFTGLLAFRLTKKWSVGLLALLFIIFSPRIFGESMNNPKDIPYASGFIMGIYFFIALLQDFPNKKWIHGVGIFAGFALAFGVRSAGGILQVAYIGLIAILYYWFDKEQRQQLFAEKNKQLKQILLVTGVSLLVGYVAGLATWPWGQQSPISNTLEALQGMTNRDAYLRVLFEGKYYMSNAMPWYYEFKWMFISNPVPVLLGFVLLPILVMKAMKLHGKFAVVFVLFGSFFPILYMVYKHSTVYDTWRHVFFVYPFWVMASVMGWDVLSVWIKDVSKQWIPKGVALLLLLPAIIWTVRSHPNQYVYFNELEGGHKGAYGYYDLDYYQNTGKQACDWILKNAKPVKGKRLMVRTNMSGFGQYFIKDTSWIVGDYGRYTERHHLDWDYYVAYPRYVNEHVMRDNKWKLANVVHTIEVDGVPLCVVIQRKDTSGIEANNAYEKKDFATAATKYAAFTATDNTDEYAYMNYAIALASIGQVDAAIKAAERATELEPGKPEFFDLLAQLYKGKGDIQNAEKAMAAKNDLIMEIQEMLADMPE